MPLLSFTSSSSSTHPPLFFHYLAPAIFPFLLFNVYHEKSFRMYYNFSILRPYSLEFEDNQPLVKMEFDLILSNTYYKGMPKLTLHAWSHKIGGLNPILTVEDYSWPPNLESIKCISIHCIQNAGPFVCL